MYSLFLHVCMEACVFCILLCADLLCSRRPKVASAFAYNNIFYFVDNSCVVRRLNL